MTRRIGSIMFCLLLCGDLGLAPALGQDASAEWRAGAASIVITPSQYMWMSGYGSREHAAEGKLTELYAKALVLEDLDRRPAVLITLDLVGIDRDLSQQICRDLERRFGLPRERIALCCSHTHSGPVVGRNLDPLHYRQLPPPQRQQVDDYVEALRENIAKVVHQAMQALAPARLSIARGTADFAVNRRNNPEADVPRLRDEGRLQGPVDHEVPVLAIEDLQGKLKTVVFGYACHATVLSSYFWCADYPGFAQQELEEALPGVVAMFWAGCGADVNPLPRRSVELARQYGKQLAAAVRQALYDPRQAIPPRLQCSYRETALALAQAPTKQQWQEQLASDNRHERARAEMILEAWEAGRPPAETYPYPIACWRLGQDDAELTWIFLGGEVVVDFAIRIKELLAPRSCWATAYSNDVMAYIPSVRVLREGGYEGGGAMVYYGLPAFWAPELEQTILEEARRQAGFGATP